MAYLWRRCTSPDKATWWFMLGLTTWLIVTPHAHEYDDILVLPAVWWTWRCLRATGLDLLLQGTFWVLWVLCPLLFMFRFNFSSLPIKESGGFPNLVLLGALVLVSKRQQPTERAH